MKKRVCFPAGNQKNFLFDYKIKSNLTWKELAKKLKVNESTLTKSYLFESCQIPYNLFKGVVGETEENEEEILERYSGKIVDEVLFIGRRILGEQRNVLNKVKITYKKKNVLLDNSRIDLSKKDKEKQIKLPNKITPELAEEIGMHYGDGFLSEKRNTYRLKGNIKDEVEYYTEYIRPLFKKLYNIDISLKEYDSVFGFELYSQAIWEFKTKTLGIKPGKKYDLNFPDILKVNNLKILASFIRGLFDTDGNITFQTKYNYKNYYPVISISLTSKKVIEEVGKILKMLGFNPWIGFNKQYGRISLYGIGAFKKYKDLVGWNSPKNLNKIAKWEGMYPELANSMAVVA